MMKSKFLVFTALLLCIFVTSQEVKVKKGEIQLDGKSVAKIDKEKNIYTISDLSGKALFTATITNQTPLKNTASKSWLQLTGNNGVVKEVELIPSTSFSFGLEKPITENLTKSNDPLLPSSGIDEAKINSFFQSEDRNISKAEDVILEKEKKIVKAEDSLAKTNKLVIDSKGIISANNQKIGYIIRKSTGKDQMQEFLSYTVLDINKISVAQVNFSSYDAANAKSGLILKTYDGKSFPIKANYTSEKIDYDNLAPRVVNKLYANGYTLGDMKALVEIANKENADAFYDEKNKLEAEAKANSRNIYDVNGYVIDKNGAKQEGKITIEFESIDAILGRDKNVSNLTNFGGSVNLTVNGKTENYRAKDGVKFCAGERCFIGTQGSEDGGLNSGSGSQLGVLGESQFFEIQHESNGNYVLNHVKTSKHSYLKLAKQPKAIYLGEKATFGTKKPEKIKKIFDEYVNCSALDFSKYDTKTKEGLVQVLTDYQSSCSK